MGINFQVSAIFINPENIGACHNCGLMFKSTNGAGIRPCQKLNFKNLAKIWYAWAFSAINHPFLLVFGSIGKELKCHYGMN
mgnify:CR=1 FL=1|jgi:hypothetical protein